MPTSFRARWLVVTTLAGILIVAAAVFAGKQLGRSQQSTLDQARAYATAATVASLKLNAYEACGRGNQQRIAINKSTDGTYRAFFLNGTLEINAAKVGKDPKRKALEIGSGQSILNAANDLQYLPLTDCNQSTKHPSTYKLAAPYSYATYLAALKKHKHP